MTPDAARSRSAGVVYAALAYLWWGTFPLYFRALKGVPAPEVLSHRIFWSALFMAGLITALRRWGEVLRQLADRRTLLWLACSAALISTNWLVYIWAVNAGHVLEASLGYFVNPLISVLLGVLSLREPLSRRQLAAVALAALGVLSLVIQAGVFPWIALTLAFSFGLYGLVRKRLRVDATSGLLAEVTVLLPLAVAYLTWLGVRGEAHFGDGPRFTTLLALSGVMTAVPLLWFAVGVQRLRLATVGLLQYLNPTAQFLIAVFVFGEHFSGAHAVAFGAIWASLALYTSDALSRG